MMSGEMVVMGMRGFDYGDENYEDDDDDHD